MIEKKKDLIIKIGLVLLLIFGCTSIGIGIYKDLSKVEPKYEEVDDNEEKKEEISQFEKDKETITSFFKNYLSSIWTYSKDKLTINSDYSTEIVLNSDTDWIMCAENSRLAAAYLNKGLISKLESIPKLTYICKNGEGNITGKVVVNDIINTNDNNFDEKAEYYDSNNNKINSTLKQAYKNQCKSYSYKEIFRNPENYIGEYFKATGEVIQVTDTSENGFSYFKLRVNITRDSYGWYSDTIMVNIPKSRFNGRIIEDDIISFYGVLDSPVTYTTVLGSEMTIPSMHAKYADLIK